MATNKEEALKFTAKSPRVMDCVCESAYQDERYGKGKRLHNPKKDKKWSCTVCGRVAAE
jgi:hypothetical protein